MAAAMALASGGALQNWNAAAEATPPASPDTTETTTERAVATGVLSLKVASAAVRL